MGNQSDGLVSEQGDHQVGEHDKHQVRTKLARQTTLAAIAHGANLLPFILWFVAAQRLGPTEFGRFAAALAFASLFEVFGDLGLRDTIVRELARNAGALALARALLTWRLCLVVGTTAVILGAYAVLRPGGDLAPLLWILAPTVALKALKHYQRGVFQGLGRFATDARTAVFERAAILGVGILALQVSPSAVALAYGLAVARLVDTASTSWIAVRNVGLTPGWNWPRVRSAQISALPVGLFLALVSAYAYADQLMLAAWRGAHAVGLYTAGYKIHEGLTLVPAILAAPLLPALSANVATLPQTASAIGRRVFKYAWIAGLGVAIPGSLAAETILSWIYGAEYSAARWALVALFWASVFTFALWMVNQVLIATAKRRAMLALAAGGLGLNLLLNAWWIPRWGATGAASATVVGEAIALVASLGVAARALPGFGAAAGVGRAVAAGAIALGSGWLARHWGAPPWTAALVAMLVYAGMLLGLRAIDRTDLAVLRRSAEAL